MSVIDEVRQLLDGAMEIAEGQQLELLQDVADRLDAPLRLAIAGRVKAGKSTLLNALVGEAVAPTDAAECTKVVTWYVDGLTYRAWLHPASADDPRQVPFTREPGNAHIDISGTPIDDIDHLRVEFPSQNLKGLNLIDTPGTTSVSETVSQRTSDFLLTERETPVDVVIYLMRHLHDSDVDFLEAFTGEGRETRPAMAIGVLSRADEMGGGRADAMDIANRAAVEFSDDPRLRMRVQTVVPVAGLLGFTGATLREEEFQLLRRMTRSSIDSIDGQLASVDAFIGGDAIAGSTEEERRALVDRLGMHGIRFGVASIMHGTTTSAQDLARALEAHSGLGRLRALVRGLFAERQAVVKANLALGLVEDVAASAPRSVARKLEGEIERIRATSHEIAELEALNELRIDPPADLDDERRLDAERILGSHGADLAARLGLDGDHTDDEIRAHVLDVLQTWRAVADRPLVSRELRILVPTVLMTLERLYASSSA